MAKIDCDIPDLSLRAIFMPIRGYRLDFHTNYSVLSVPFQAHFGSFLNQCVVLADTYSIKMVNIRECHSKVITKTDIPLLEDTLYFVKIT